MPLIGWILGLMLFPFAPLVPVEEQPELIKGLELFAPLSPFTAALGPEGRLYLLDKRECRVRVVNESGEVEQSFGKRGQGPGELNTPVSIGVDARRVFVYGVFQVSLFDLEGRFLHRLERPNLSTLLHAAGEGFMGMSEPPSGNSRVLWFNADLSERKVVLEWHPEPIQYPPKVFKSGTKTASYNPAPELLPVQYAPSGGIAYLGHQGEPLKISVIDLSDLSVTSFTRPERALPFNRQWGQQQIDRINAVPGSRIHFTLEDVSHFPIIRELRVGPEDQCVLRLWTGAPDTRDAYLVLDREGKESELGFHPKYVNRLIGIYGARAYLAAWDEDDGAYVVACRRSEIDAVAAAHPWSETVGEPKAFIRIH